MKNNFLYAGLVLAILSACQSKKEETSPSLAGVYEMESQAIYANASDSLLSNGNQSQQHKLYSDGHYLWINVGQDSVANFGVGSYTQQDSVVTETNVYNSGGEENAIAYTLHVEMKEKGYVQRIPSMKYQGQDIRIEETYRRVAGREGSAFDGLWKAQDNYFVKGKDTTRRNYPDYKLFHGGHFVWGIRALTDTSKQVHTSYVGSGTFTINGDQMEELTQLSNIAGNGKTLVKIVKKSEDDFLQSIQQPDGSIRFTAYKKVK